MPLSEAADYGSKITWLKSPDINLDGQYHSHPRHIPETSFDLALRCEAVSNVPQIEFEQDDVWHDFAPKAAPDLLRRRRSMRS